MTHYYIGMPATRLLENRDTHVCDVSFHWLVVFDFSVDNDGVYGVIAYVTVPDAIISKPVQLSLINRLF